jgi:hypothetical protein
MTEELTKELTEEQTARLKAMRAAYPKAGFATDDEVEAALYASGLTPEEFTAAIDKMETQAEIYGFAYKFYGEKILHLFLATSGSFREQLDEAADQLAAVKMFKASAIVREYAARAPESKYHCPFPEVKPFGWKYQEWYGTWVVPYHTAEHWIANQQRKYPGDFDLTKVQYVDPSKPYQRPAYIED